MIEIEVGKRYKFLSDKNGVIGYCSYLLYDVVWCFGEEDPTTSIKSSVFTCTVYSISDTGNHVFVRDIIYD